MALGDRDTLDDGDDDNGRLGQLKTKRNLVGVKKFSFPGENTTVARNDEKFIEREMSTAVNVCSSEANR